MGADMMARTIYLPADTTIDLAAAKATASRLCQQASPVDLRILREHGWIDDDTLPDSTTDDQLAARAEQLRTFAERELHTLLDRFARSLHRRDVYRHRFDRSRHRRDVYRHRFDRDDRVGIDAYTTGGLSYGDGPTDAFDDWDVVFDDDRFPHRWPARLGAAAGLLHPWGDGPPAPSTHRLTR
ncbi:MAG: hypothetical protein ACM30G_19710 [Micromonosporaceae bacterium]